MNEPNQPRENTTATVLVVVAGLLLLGFCGFGIILGPILMGMQSQRAEARRMTCMSNMRQLGMAAIDYHDLHNHFPAGWIYSEQQPDQPQWGWPAQMLQHLEQKPLFDALDQLEIPLYQILDDPSPIAAEVLSRRLGVLSCPADDFQQFGGASHPDRRYLGPQEQPIPLGLTMYVGNTGHLHDASGDQPNSGIFFGNSQITFQDVTDGISHTILLGERDLTNCRAGSWPGVPRPNTHDGGLAIWNVVAGAKPALNARPWDGDTLCGEGFSSGHPGVVNVLMCDGSVRALANTIDSHWNEDPTEDIGVLQKLMIRDDGEDVAF